MPFFLDLFRGSAVHRVLDFACGTGRHAGAFRREGFDLAATDVSEETIEIA